MATIEQLPPSGPEVTVIDRIDSKGNIRGHYTATEIAALCGQSLLGQTQKAAGNGLCKSCARIAKMLNARVTGPCPYGRSGSGAPCNASCAHDGAPKAMIDTRPAHAPGEE